MSSCWPRTPEYRSRGKWEKIPGTVNTGSCRCFANISGTLQVLCSHLLRSHAMAYPLAISVTVTSLALPLHQTSPLSATRKENAIWRCYSLRSVCGGRADGYHIKNCASCCLSLRTSSWILFVITCPGSPGHCRMALGLMFG